jgi:hypothetical protein
MARKITDAELQEILEFVWANQDAWYRVPAAQIATHFGLGMQQAYYRMRLVKKWDITITRDGKVIRLPLFSKKSGANGYRLSTDPDERDEYLGSGTKDVLSRLETIVKEAIDVFTAHLPLAEREDERRRLERPFRRLLEDMGDMVAANKRRPPSPTF